MWDNFGDEIFATAFFSGDLLATSKTLLTILLYAFSPYAPKHQITPDDIKHSVGKPTS